MVERGTGPHIDLARLAAYAAGDLGREQTDEIAAHVAACHECRLELVQWERFEQLDRDAELLAEADWPGAQAALDRGFRERVAPAARRGGPALVPRLPRSPARLAHWWVVPAAAAAVLAIALLGQPGWRGGGEAVHGDGPVRGGGAAAPALVAVAPTGRLPAPPERFTWRARGVFDAFELEVVTPRLDVVFTRSGIRDTSLVVPDTLLDLLRPGRTYLWSVRGVRGLNVEAVSSQAWFAFAREPRRR